MNDPQGQSTQDNELAGVRDAWAAADIDTKNQFVSWLEDEDPHNARDVFGDYPTEWVAFVQRCAACGMRQMLLDEEETQ